jgi:hypothetical protein
MDVPNDVQITRDLLQCLATGVIFSLGKMGWGYNAHNSGIGLA